MEHLDGVKSLPAPLLRNGEEVGDARPRPLRCSTLPDTSSGAMFASPQGSKMGKFKRCLSVDATRRDMKKGGREILDDMTGNRALNTVAGVKLFRRISQQFDTPLTLEEEDLQLSEGLSASEVCVAISNLVVGNGLLAVPFGFVLCGWIAIPITVLGVAMMAYTAILLGDALDAVRADCPDEPGYGTIGERAFGPSFSPVSLACCVGECFSLLIFFTAFIGQSISTSFNVPINVVICITTGVGVMVKWIPKRFLAVLSLLGIVIVSSSVAACMYSGIELREYDRSQSLFGTKGITSAFAVIGSLSIAAADHAVFPSVYNSAASKEAYRKGVFGGFCVFLAVCLLLCTVTYATFGTSLNAVVLTNIGREVDGSASATVPRWFSQLFNLLLTVRCLQVLPVFQQPVITACFNLLDRRGIDLTAPEDVESELSLLKLAPRVFMGRQLTSFGIYVCSSACAVVLSGQLETLEAVTGALFKSINAFIVPCWGCHALCNEELKARPFRRCINLFLLAFGVVWGLAGTTVSIMSVLKPTSS